MSRTKRVRRNQSRNGVKVVVHVEMDDGGVVGTVVMPTAGASGFRDESIRRCAALCFSPHIAAI